MLPCIIFDRMPQEDYRRLVAMPAALPLPDWLKGLRETDDMPLTPLVGGPLTLQYGTGRAFMAGGQHGQAVPCKLTTTHF